MTVQGYSAINIGHYDVTVVGVVVHVSQCQRNRLIYKYTINIPTTSWLATTSYLNTLVQSHSTPPFH